jgi:hypothetical protein
VSAFTNLNFESATLVPIYSSPYYVYFNTALPGWSGFAGTSQFTVAVYDTYALGSANISILDSNFSAPIQGNYTVLLQAGGVTDPDSGTNVFVDVSLSQTGLVPLGTRSLTFLASLAFPSSPFTVSLGGTDLNLISFPVANQNYSLYEADVSAFAGQTAELTFTALTQKGHAQDCWLSLDAIQFSSDPIPEPSGLSLLAIGVVALGCWRVTYRKTA